MSPTVFRHGPYRFYFSRAKKLECTYMCNRRPAKQSFRWSQKIELAQNYGLNTRQLNNAKRLVQEHEDEIREAWQTTSAVEVANVSPHGFWLMIDRTEYFLPFENFPWFRDATIGELTNVQLPSPHHPTGPS